ncbi:MAG: hypothetical protein IJ845_08415 [Bacteroidaceae bacterium]|nr:hypothetical protein [Bacteroidaceae bacterium]
MEKTGWILLTFGGLSFLGAAIKGHDVLGPCFFMALGLLLIYLGKNKAEKKEDDING